MRKPRSSWPRRCGYAVVTVGLLAAPARPGDTPEPAGNVVLEWNAIALAATAAAPFNPPMEARNLAIVHAAIFDAASNSSGTFRPHAAEREPDRSASAEAAVAAAAHLALVSLYPSRRAELDAALAASLAPLTDGRAKEAGVRRGEAAAAAILAARAADGALAAATAAHVPGNAPGDWRPTVPGSLPALCAGWGAVVPFVLARGSELRPEPPPPLGSRVYARDFEEVQEIGSATSARRTAAQTDLARFWVETGAQLWNTAARQIARARRRSLAEDARAFALLNLAGADAFIAAWDAKFAYAQWRPVTAIRAADEDGNPDTLARPEWMPLLVTPPFPDYVAGHTAYAGAAATVLDHVFGKDPGVVMTLTSRTAPGVTRTYTRFDDMAADVVDARVWGGVHWRTSCVRGRELGAQVGAYVVQRALATRRR